MLKNGDFVKVQYTGYDDRGNQFDSTDGEVAKALHGKEGPLLVVIGKHRLVKGLEDTLKSMKKDDEKEVVCAPEIGFGYKDKHLVKIMNEMDFYKNNIRPEPGLTVHVDTDQGRMYGTIKSSNSGRILVDFNHPLAGKTVKYKIKLVEVLENHESKVKAVVDETGVKWPFKLENDDIQFTIPMKEEMIEEKKGMLLTLINGLTPEVKKIEFKEAES